MRRFGFIAVLLLATAMLAGCSANAAKAPESATPSSSTSGISGKSHGSANLKLGQGAPNPESFPVVNQKFAQRSYQLGYSYSPQPDGTTIWYGAFYDITTDPASPVAVLLSRTPQGFAVVEGDALNSAFPNHQALEKALEKSLRAPHPLKFRYYIGANDFN